jgi:serine/threonine-protein kinase
MREPEVCSGGVKALVLVAILSCGAAACSSSSGPSGGEDASSGRDASGAADASMGADASPNADASPRADASPSADASANTDAAARPDASPGMDAVQGVDAAPPQPDAGPSLTAFPQSSTIYADISLAPVDSNWTTILQNALANGFGGPFQLDPSFNVNYADPSVARRPFQQPSGALPDCDTSPVPVPAGGKTEGEPDYDCAGGGDCHLLVYQGTRLYELYQGSITGGQAIGGTFTGSCLVVWDLTHDYWQPGTPFSRGDGCNGSDAADMPIAPLLLNKAEIAAHQIDHAMRFTIDNSKIDNTYYVHPATHLGGSGPSGTTIPYGSRLRLRSTFDVSTLATPEARAIAVALQRHGMFMDDGGGFYVSATTDITDVIDTHALNTLVATDFEMIDGGTRINFHQQNCTRTPITN